MRKLLVVTVIFAAFLVFACGKHDPQSVARDYVEKQFKGDQPIRTDMSGLKYEIVEKTDNHATIQVSGTVNFEGKIYLVKEGRNWKIAENGPVITGPAIVH
jgi:hypothetical protein